MSTTLRAAAATLFGFPPVFRRAKRLDPPPARVEPGMPAPAVPQPSTDTKRVDVQRLLAATRNAAPVELSIIEWDGDSDAIPVVHELAEPRTGHDDDDIACIRSAVAEEHGVQAAAVVLVEPGALPRTGSGKVRRGPSRQAFLDRTLSRVVAADPIDER